MDSNTGEKGSSNLVAPPSTGLSRRGLLEIGLRHRRVVLFTVVLFLAVAFLYLFKATPIYRSTARLYVEQSGPRIISEYEGVMTGSKNYLYTQAELLKSTPIISSVVDDAQIGQFRTFCKTDNLVGYLKNNLSVSVGRKDDIIAVSFDCPYPVEAAQIVNSLVDSYVSYHSSRKRSTVSEVLRILQKEKVKRDKELTDKFNEMLQFTRANGVASFDDKGGNIVFQRLAKLSTALTDAQLATINARTDFEAVKSMVNEPAKVKQFAMAQPSSGVRVFTTDDETQLRNKLKDLELQLRNVKYHCTEQHPSTKALQSNIGRIEGQLENQAKEFAEAYLEVMRLRWMGAKEREDELLASFRAQQKAAQELGIKVTEYAVLQSELRRLERLCEILDERIKELNVTEDAGALNISVLEAARPLSNPSKPQKARVLAMALVLGLLCGCGLAILRDWLDYRLCSVDEISAVLGVPVLGVVPTMAEERSILTWGQKVWLKLKRVWAKAYGRLGSVSPSGSSESESASVEGLSEAVPVAKPRVRSRTIIGAARQVRRELKSVSRRDYRTVRATAIPEVPRPEASTVAITSGDLTDVKRRWEKQTIVDRGQKVHLRPRSIVAEAYRTIRTAVFFGVPKGEAKTILVTSPASGDGKSTLVSNLAIAMAQAGQRTLVLDCDFRKPMQCKIFDLDNKTGLSNVLAGALSFEQATQAGPVEGIDILACGPEVPNPAEILGSDAFARVLRDFSERYDRVIIDSPPVTPVADSQILGAICDVTVLVLRAEKSTARASQHTRDCLSSVGSRLLGVVVNDVPRKHRRYGYYSYYRGYGYYGSYGYGYGHTEREKTKQYKQKVSA